MEEYIDEEAYDLSLGQKQRITIAGVLCYEPSIIVMDEPTAMLDSEGKEDIIEIVTMLKAKGFTIIYITNVIDEIFVADRVVMIEEGQIIKEFLPKDILENMGFLKEKGIAIPKAVQVLKKLQNKGIKVELDDLI